MSRIGENPITIPEGVSVSKANGVITVTTCDTYTGILFSTEMF